MLFITPSIQWQKWKIRRLWDAISVRHWFAFLLLLIFSLLFVLWPAAVRAQSGTGIEPTTSASVVVPLYWYLMTAMIALLAPIGFVLVGVAGLAPEHAWNAALGGLAAVGLATWAYWAVGFAIQFGGVGL